jgi:hypothetical protein
MTVSIRWAHGLGDSSHFAHTLNLWIKRGHQIEIECEPFLRPLFECAGATITSKGKKDHSWIHGLIGPLLPVLWSGNKVAGNLRSEPMPDIGDTDSLWQELLPVRLNFPTRPIPAMPRPLVVCHMKGASGPLFKNLPDWMERRFLDQLLASRIMAGGRVVLIDPDHRTQIRHQQCGRLEKGSLVDLISWIGHADLFVGIDSGPLHSCRLTNTPAIGVWMLHVPWYFTLPREKTRHLVQRPCEPWRMQAYNCQNHGDSLTYPDVLARMALEELEKRNASTIS